MRATSPIVSAALTMTSSGHIVRADRDRRFLRLIAGMLKAGTGELHWPPLVGAPRGWLFAGAVSYLPGQPNRFVN